MHGHVRAVLHEVRVELPLEEGVAIATPLRSESRRGCRSPPRVDDRRALLPQVGERGVEQPHDFGIRRRRFIRRPEHADASAFEPVLLEKRRVAHRNVASARERHGIGGVGARDDLQHGNRVSHRSREWTSHIRPEIERDHPGSACQSQRGSDANERVVRGRATNGVAPVSRSRCAHARQSFLRISDCRHAVPPFPRDPAGTRSSAYGLCV